MRISFSPQYRTGVLTMSRAGDVLTINGDSIDFSVLPDGADILDGHTLHPSLTGKVERVDGELQLTVVWPYRADGHVDAPPDLVDPPDGVLAIPTL